MVGVSFVLMFIFFFSAKEYCYAEQETVKSEKAEKYKALIRMVVRHQ